MNARLEKWVKFAAVILDQSGSVSAADLRDWINARVAAKFQRVHAVVIMGDFPRNVAGKTLKRVMRDNYGKNHK
jgi:acyl-CoA synthetase (AMP-forming)/AMP-acid ligase II